jgi:hypothetical protein
VAGESQLKGNDDSKDKEHVKPTDVIGNVIGGIANIPEGIAESAAGTKNKEKNDVKSELGGAPK